MLFGTKQVNDKVVENVVQYIKDSMKRGETIEYAYSWASVTYMIPIVTMKLIVAQYFGEKND